MFSVLVIRLIFFKAEDGIRDYKVTGVQTCALPISGMYAVLGQGGLPAALRLPVAAYVLVIALMAAQALGRARHLGGQPAWTVAIGACFFMASDSLLAINRFVQPRSEEHTSELQSPCNLVCRLLLEK